MKEVYICICGNKDFKILEGFIQCAKCLEIYNLKRHFKHNGTMDHILQDPEDFNKRIRAT